MPVQQLVLLEAAELVSENVDTAQAVEAVVELIGLEKVMFELPGPWIAGVTAHDIHHLRRQLIGRYGPEVNLGNVAPADLVSLEAYRRGLGLMLAKLSVKREKHSSLVVTQVAIIKSARLRLRRESKTLIRSGFKATWIDISKPSLHVCSGFGNPLRAVIDSI